MEHFGFLCTAYSLIFAVIFLYVVFIGQRQRRIEAQIDAAEAQLKAVREKLDVPRSAEQGVEK
jgi:CcmD family protein